MLYAQWKTTFTANFEYNGGTNVNGASKSMIYDTEYSLIVPVKTNYVFKGWKAEGISADAKYKKSDDSWDSIAADVPFRKNVTEDTVVKNLTNAAGGTVTLTAQWAQYKIYYGDGVKNVMYDGSPIATDEPIIPGKRVTYTKADGYDSVLNFGLDSNYDTTESDVTILSKKSASEPPVVPPMTEDSDKATLTVPNTPAGAGEVLFAVKENLAVKIDTADVTFKGKVVEVELKVDTANPDRYEFELKVGGTSSGTASPRMEVSLPYDSARGIPSVYWDNAGTPVPMEVVSYGGGVVTFATTHNSFYVITYVMPATGQSVKVTLNANGGALSQTLLNITSGGKYGNLPIPTRVGYSFSGWYNGATNVNSNTPVANSDHTLIAMWTLVQETEGEDTGGAGIAVAAVIAAAAAMAVLALAAVLFVTHIRRS